MANRSRPVHTICSNRSVDDAVHLMAGKKASALIVMQNERPVGIFAERDVFRYYASEGNVEISTIPVQNAMTHKLIFAKPEDDIDAVMALMIKTDIKHMPVMEKDDIIGMLMLNDLIEHQIESLAAEIRHLREYIADLHDAGQD